MRRSWPGHAGQPSRFLPPGSGRAKVFKAWGSLIRFDMGVSARAGIISRQMEDPLYLLRAWMSRCQRASFVSRPARLLLAPWQFARKFRISPEQPVQTPPLDRQRAQAGVRQQLPVMVGNITAPSRVDVLVDELNHNLSDGPKCGSWAISGFDFHSCAAAAGDGQPGSRSFRGEAIN